MILHGILTGGEQYHSQTHALAQPVHEVKKSGVLCLQILG